MRKDSEDKFQDVVDMLKDDAARVNRRFHSGNSPISRRGVTGPNVAFLNRIVSQQTSENQRIVVRETRSCSEKLKQLKGVSSEDPRKSTAAARADEIKAERALRAESKTAKMTATGMHPVPQALTANPTVSKVGPRLVTAAPWRRSMERVLSTGQSSVSKRASVSRLPLRDINGSGTDVTSRLKRKNEHGKES